MFPLPPPYLCRAADWLFSHPDNLDREGDEAEVCGAHLLRVIPIPDTVSQNMFTRGSASDPSHSSVYSMVMVVVVVVVGQGRG